jgi:myo-inositol-hexaphosphate 3-phosphohydrolase
MLALLFGTSVLAATGAALVSGDLPECQIYAENQCVGDQIATDQSFESHRWFTPRKGDADYISSFQVPFPQFITPNSVKIVF